MIWILFKVVILPIAALFVLAIIYGMLLQKPVEKKKSAPPKDEDDEDEEMIGAVPDWAGFFTPSQYSEFMLMVMEYCRERGLQAEVDAGQVMQDGERLGDLSEVAAACQQQDSREWKVTIRDYFQRKLEEQSG